MLNDENLEYKIPDNDNENLTIAKKDDYIFLDFPNKYVSYAILLSDIEKQLKGKK